MRWPSWWNTSDATSKESETNKNSDDLLSRVQDVSEEVISTVRSELPDKKTVNNALDHITPPSSSLRSFTEPQTLIAAVVLTATSLGVLKLYKTFLRRIPEAKNIKPEFFRKRSIIGKVTSVGDGDNFRIYHTPGGWLAGWGWLPGRRIPTNKKELKNQTIHVRLAGIDAPELAHFGNPAQPYSQDALNWLTSYLRGRRVRIYLHRADQYSRVVGTAYVWKGIFRRDVGLQMLRAGLATIYEAKTGVEFREGQEEKYRRAEWWAKTKRKGIWSTKKSAFESPREYKQRHSGSSGINDSSKPA